MTRLPGHAAVVLVLLLCAWNPARSQQADQGIRIGQSTLYPSIEMEYTDDDNLFQTSDLQSDDIVDAQVLEVGPTLDWRLSLPRVEYAVVYKPHFKFYKDDVLPSTTTHKFSGKLERIFRNEGRLIVEDEFERGILELREFTGNEPTFAGDRFSRNNFKARIRVPRGPRQSWESSLFTSLLEFDDPEQAAFFDYTDYGVGSGWLLGLSEQLSYRIDAKAAVTEPSRADLTTCQRSLSGPCVAPFDPMTDQTVVINDFQEEDFTRLSIQSGFEGIAGDRWTLQSYLGYVELTFDDSEEKNYRGHILDSDIRFRMTRSLSVGLITNRRVFPSSFNVANFFIAEGANLSVYWSSSRERLKLSVTASRQDNSYKDPIVTNADGDINTGFDVFGNEFVPDAPTGFLAGVLRQDRIERVQGRVDFEFSERKFSAFFAITNEDRTSNISSFEYSHTVASLGLRFGWFPTSSGGI